VKKTNEEKGKERRRGDGAGEMGSKMPVGESRMGSQNNYFGVGSGEELENSREKRVEYVIPPKKVYKGRKSPGKRVVKISRKISCVAKENADASQRGRHGVPHTNSRRRGAVGLKVYVRPVTRSGSEGESKP